MRAAALALLSMALASPLPAEPGDMAIDPYYFENTSSKFNQTVEGVVTILADREGNPNDRGVKALDFKKSPDGPADSPCRNFTLRDVKPDAPGRPVGKQACDVRLLGWNEDEGGDRIQLPVTRTQRKGKDLWLQVVRDPDDDKRSWLRLEPTRMQGQEPTMEFVSLGRWVGSTGAVRRRPYRAFGSVMLHNSPSTTAQVVDTQPSAIDAVRQNPRRIVNAPRFDPNVFPLRYLGIQGAWIRVELVTRECRSEAADTAVFDSLMPRCVAGWVRWRDADGEIFMYPISQQFLRGQGSR